MSTHEDDFDFTIEDQGTIVLVRPYTEDAREWLHEQTDGNWFAGALCVEPRYLNDLIDGLAREGFTAR